MKSKDIFSIVAIGIFSLIVAFVFSSIFINTDKNRSEKVEVIPVISSDLKRPSNLYYNSESINPTQTIQIGGERSEQPFGSQ